MPTLLEERQLSRSALRHRPISPDAVNTQVSTPRASRQRQKHEPHTTGGPPSVYTTKARSPWPVYLVLGGLLALVLLWLGQVLWSWGQQTLNDLRYGRPRTTQVDHAVGHGGGTSHFIATNLNGQIYVVEIPGGQPNNAHLLVGPHLIGQGADLAPVTLSFVGDVHTPDLVISVDGVQMTFHNTGTSYIPASP